MITAFLYNVIAPGMEHAHVPPFGEDGALEELERAIRQDGLRGVDDTAGLTGAAWLAGTATRVRPRRPAPARPPLPLARDHGTVSPAEPTSQQIPTPSSR